ncbi:MAG: potassium-transporting ATPase subunit KdpA, partial [Chloroflexota bacterium]
MVFDILQMVIVLALAFAIVFPLGRYIAAVFMLKPTLADPVLNPIDGVIYRACGIKPEQQMRWPAYVKAMLLTNLAMWLLIFSTLEVQHLPLFGAL